METRLRVLLWVLVGRVWNLQQITARTQVGNKTEIKLGVMVLDSNGANTWIDYRYIGSAVNMAIEDVQNTGALADVEFR